MNLAMLKPGERGKITNMGAIGSLKRRLMDMGVLVGEEIKVEKNRAPRRPHRSNNQELQSIFAKERGTGDRGGGNKMSLDLKVQSSKLNTKTDSETPTRKRPLPLLLQATRIQASQL